MLDKLVESRKNGKDTRKLKSLLLFTSTFAFGGVIFALIFSLFSQNLAMSSEAIELTKLITPPRIFEEKQIQPEPKKNQTKTNISTEKNLPTRTKNILRLDESPTKVPQAISTKPSKHMARPNSEFKIGTVDSNPKTVFSNNSGISGAEKGVIGDFDKPVESKPIKSKEKEVVPPKPKKQLPPPPPPVEKKHKPTVVSGGVVNGKAKSLVKPVYPSAAKIAQIRGKVTVQVLISENGKVISANATSGHKLLRQNAEIAARRSTFTPTTLSKQKVKVRGIIVYNFN